MIRLAVSNSPVDAAWAEFDTAAILLHRMYANAGPTDTPADRMMRMEASQDVVRLWDTWRDLFLTINGDEPRPAA